MCFPLARIIKSSGHTPIMGLVFACVVVVFGLYRFFFLGCLCMLIYSYNFPTERTHLDVTHTFTQSYQIPTLFPPSRSLYSVNSKATERVSTTKHRPDVVFIMLSVKRFRRLYVYTMCVYVVFVFMFY